ncbi:hypothetical protein C5167_037944 [Papaver somniferum]|uniref:Complex 1 LYR protein domain-containing protein n=1 Tax=Papaver somniferum TaxID=3469 RepID=A0A4Y7IB10_PAPSO|nr:uncharacterized protein LOC113330595 [Papaver somniferum]RZC45000.1 hypothetical protein C5167_037944 [Papaver somniferum]
MAMMNKCRKLIQISVKTPSNNIINKNGMSFNFQERFLHEGPDTVEELLDRHVVKKVKNNYASDDELESISRQRVTSMKREALSLYRDIIRATRFFAWVDKKGVLWRDVLRENARKEFEESRFENDPEIITKLLIGGRDAVESALEKLAEKQRQEVLKQEQNQNNYNNRDR